VRADAVLADRRRAVREAARAWQRAGAIDAEALAGIAAAHADDRVRLRVAFRVLLFILVGLAADAALGLWFAATDPDQLGAKVALIVVGAGLLVATDVLSGRLRCAETGAEDATALHGVLFLVVGVTWSMADGLDLGRQGVATMAAAVTAVASLAACCRWGFVLQAALAAVAAFTVLAAQDTCRWLFIVASLVALPVLARATAAPALAPAHRACCQVGLGACVLALYVALNLVSWDRRWVEDLIDVHVRLDAAAVGPRWIAIVATAVLPPLLLEWGIFARRRVVLAIAIVLGVASLVTLRVYVHVAPAWLILVAGGALGLAAALLLRRWLDSGPGLERRGFTAEPLFDDPRRLRALEAAATMVTLTPEQAPEAPQAIGKGGRSGGAGATGDY
jgi:hypothetical protein